MNCVGPQSNLRPFVVHSGTDGQRYCPKFKGDKMIDFTLMDRAIDQIRLLNKENRVDSDIDEDWKPTGTRYVNGSEADHQYIDTGAAWTQSSWRTVQVDTEGHRCNTGMCLAGWVAELSPEVAWKVDEATLYRAERAVTHLWTAHTDLLEVIRSVPKLEDTERERLSEMAETTRQSWSSAFDILRGLKSQLELVVMQDGSECPVEDWATERLGLETYQASALFHGDNDFGAIQKYRDRLQDNPTGDPSDERWDDEDEDYDDEDDDLEAV